ncbi:hypothetical protein BFJ68_g12406 [Fusarium oxysporum]|uniref:Uncharacterized protein n=1 Tax=Fusarium oxysporum TaxID=5507 RepID=A0A420Q990_FUSOX|nr:hypothetical protein BFJ68_g12406 [Fusarium oxysporum]RKL11629.1 hypothetical protein BFJ71_g112 [Fusarium oxysporum]
MRFVFLYCIVSVPRVNEPRLDYCDLACGQPIPDTAREGLQNLWNKMKLKLRIAGLFELYEFLSRAKKTLVETLKVKGLKWCWRPFIDERYTHLGDVCVRTMDNDIFLRMINDNPSIIFEEYRKKGESDVPRDPAIMGINPDFSEIEKCGGRVLAWYIIGTTG